MGDHLKEFYENLDQRYTQGDLEEVERFLLERAEQTQQGGNTGEQIAACNELGSFYRGTSHYQKSLAFFARARTLTAQGMGESCSQYATILNNMAGTYRLTGEHQKAIELFLEALHTYHSRGEEGSYAYASVLNNLSLVYRETNQLDEAISYLQQALTVIEKLPGHRQEIAITYNNLTALYYASGDRVRAMDCLNRALKEFERCADDENVHYAAGLNSMAGFLYAEGDCARALAIYQKSLHYTKRFFGENIEYGITCQNMYWAYEKLGDRKAAIAALVRAKEIYTRLLGETHERTCAVAATLQRLQEA